MQFPWERVEVGEKSECWPINVCESQRYGRIVVEGEALLAHRAVYESEVGDIGDKHVLHECDNPACVNPNHLFLGTQSDNMKDMYQKGRRKPIAGEDGYHAKITEDDVHEIRQRYEDGETQGNIAEDYPIGRTGVGAIVRRETWDHI